MKVLCYGVRDVEKPIFERENKGFGYDLTLVPDYLNTKETAYLAKGHEAVILRGNCLATPENLDIYKECGVKYLLTRTAGKDHINIPYATKLGFKMAFVPRYSPNAIADLAVFHTLMHLRHLAYTTSRTAKGNFTIDSFMFSKEIRNCTCGVIGLGRIGREAAKMYHGMGATVLGYDVFQMKGIEDFATQVSLEEIQEKADIITVHVNYQAGDPKLIDKNFLSKLKHDCILVNASRGQLADGNAICDAIENNTLGGYSADTIENEAKVFGKDFTGKEIPDPIIARMVSLYPRVLISPHLGSYTDEAAKNMVEISYQNLQDFIDTGDCKNKF